MMDINNNFVTDRRREKRKIKCVMIDETMITTVVPIRYVYLLDLSIYYRR
jgi:hypothetical protein